MSSLEAHRIVGRLPIYTPRPKNFQALADLELTGRRRDEIVFGLRMANYSHTIPDSDGDLLVFGDRANGVEIYIKLVDHAHSVECVSFHRAEHELDYPYA